MTSPGTVEGGLAEPEELEPEQGELALASSDDLHSRADWERAAAAVLRKARRLGDDDPDAAAWGELTRTTLDGVEVTPLGTPDLLAGLVTAGRPDRVGDWDVRTRPATHEQALDDLAGGATSLWVPADADLAELLDGVPLDRIPVVLEDATAQRARELLTMAGDRLPSGTNLAASADDLVEVATMARGAGALAVVVDGVSVHERGASDAQEVGHALASAAGTLRALTDVGFGVAEAASLVELRLAATDEQFVTIAKLRAARRLWTRMLDLCGLRDGGPTMRLHAVTSRPMMSRYDPWVNMLRTTVAAFAAGVAGADAVTVVPFDSPLGDSDDVARRIARNTSHLLLSESHLGRVGDPAGGAFAVEKLTDDLALAAWEELGRIEDDGPVAFEERVAQVVAARDAQVAARTRPLTGLTEFPHLDEVLPERPGPGDGVRRWGAAFEELRDDPATRPVFLATMGPAAAHTARATSAANLFAAGGIAVETAGATETVDDVVAGYRSAGSPVACLCGSDAAYEGWGHDLVVALRTAGARRVLVADGTDLDADDHCSEGVDVLALLRRTREALA